MSWTETPDAPIFNKLNLEELNIDQYYINFNIVEHTDTLYMYYKYDDCYNCPYYINPGIDLKNDFQVLSSQPSQQWRIMSSNISDMSVETTKNIICELTPDVGEFGVYSLNISKNNCQLIVLKDPVNIYMSILTVFLIVLIASILGGFICWVYKKQMKKGKGTPNKETEYSPPIKKQRIKSLDTFRGISIVLMIFVNYGAGKYEFLDHVTWNGLHIADLIFPWFMWIMGVCIPISIKSAIKNNGSKKAAFFNIGRRSCILFILGIILNQGIVLNKIRIFGVLQRFGICYFIVASLGLLCSHIQFSEPKNKLVKIFQDIIVLIPQWLFVLVLTTIHIVITFTLKVPGCPTGYLGPGGIQDNGKYQNCVGGATGYIDRKILGDKHIYQNPTANLIYQSGPFDPEGVFGSLTSILQVFIGVQAGSTLLTYKSHTGRLLRWLLWAIITGLIGGALCGFSKEDGIIPINKNLWSVSHVMVTSSFAYIVLSACYFIIDVKHWWPGKPFLFAGMNATIMYVGHSLTYMFPFHWEFDNMNTHYLHLARAVWGTMLWVVISYALFKKKFFLSI